MRRALCLLLFLLLVLQRAWVSDDAFITLRVAENFLSGYGLRWNVFERVEVYTHPLWMWTLVLSHWISGEPFYSTICIGVLFSLSAVFLLIFRIAGSFHSSLVAFAPLVLVGTFLDYSTAGLENPLTHLLLASFFLVFLRGNGPRQRLLLTYLASLLVFNRMDAIFYIAPAAAYIAYHELRFLAELRAHERIRRVFLLCLAISPFCLWKAFSTLYYGFFFPNTYYAKLPYGISIGERLLQGSKYFLNLLHTEPLAFMVIAFSLFYALCSTSQRTRLLGVGLTLSLAYIIWIGGDFMTGRFFSAPLFLACIVVSQIPYEQVASRTLLILTAMILFSLLSPLSPLRQFDFGIKPSSCDVHVDRSHGKTGIVDERACYESSSSFMAITRGISPPDHKYRREGEGYARQKKFGVLKHGALGMLGYYSGPFVYYIDDYGLCSPLTARLPYRGGKDWRPGHFQRLIPLGLKESLLSGTNYIKDEDLRVYYEALWKITRLPVLSRERLITLIKFQLGSYDAYLLRYRQGRN